MSYRSLASAPTTHHVAIAPWPNTSQAADAPRPPPTRHGVDMATARRITRALRGTIRGNPELTPEGYASLGAALWRGDPLADAVAQWLLDTGMRTAMPMLERAIELGLVDMPDAPQPLRDYIEATARTPVWVDPTQLALGARVIHRTGQHGMRVLRDAGLMAGYQAGAINQPLVMTGALERGAQRRVAETTKWWLDCTGPGGMARQGPGFKATQRVRVMHALVRLTLKDRPDWNSAWLGLPINQVDMQATYLGFSVVHLLALRATGMVLTPAEAQAVMDLWRYIGWLMGVEEGLLCGTEMEGRITLYQNLICQAPPDDSSAALGRALMDEPLQRYYTWGAAWRGRYHKARHLSIARLFVGREGMKHLGLPPTLPWYPVLTFLPRLAWTGLHVLVPGARELQARRGRRNQLAYLPMLFGPNPH